MIVASNASKSGLILVAWSAVDYVLTLKKMDSDMRMTKQEVRQEYKETDGNPVIKSRIRQLQRAMRKKQSLQAAATVVHRSVSEFVLESALARADETLADRRVFSLNSAEWKALVTALDAPPREIPRLGRLLKEPSVFERGSV